ncbi:MAG: hypothetical protein OHK0046_52300 [Anaerolineae bacterium]
MDPQPDYTNRLAYLLGRLLHPFVVAIITLLIVLRQVPFSEAVLWTGLIGSVLIIPLAVMIVVMQRRQQYTYQRQVRGPLYALGWLSIVLCLVLTLALNAPTVLVACMAALLVWVPLQAFINARFTKVSTHVAVVTGCAVGVLLLEPRVSVPGLLITVVLIGSTAWARIVTRHHTATQVALGILTGALPVLVTFPLLLR